MIKKINTLNRNNFFLFLIFFSFFCTFINAKDLSKEASKKKEVVYTQKGEEKKWCPICGMQIKKYYKTSHTSKLQNETSRQYCSIRCLVKDDLEYGINKNSVQVVDFVSEKLINAKSAYYVLGSEVKGTMSQISKLAFLKKEEAKAFIKKYSGQIKSFDEAFDEAKKNLKTDTSFFKTKKVKKIYPKGKRIFEKLCSPDIDPTMYLEINELKADIKNNKLCKKLDESRLHALSLYLWEVKRLGEQSVDENKVQVKENEKCPVCGMFVAKYPRWAAKLYYLHNDHTHDFSFDGVKDLMKFYFNPTKWGDYKVSKNMQNTILVTDYYSQKGIDGKKAYYVIGSDVYGPMGHELIPFEKIEDAKVFKKDHAGIKIVQFDEIKEKEVYKLDE